MNILHLHGDYEQMGRQHSAQIRRLRPALIAAMVAREDELARLPYDYSTVLSEACDFMAEEGRPTWDMLRGIAAGLDIEWERLQRYTLSSYLLDYRHKVAASTNKDEGIEEGCTTFAVSAPVGYNGMPLLAKNRDYRLDHLDLQSLTYSTPEQGYRYLHFGSAGSPGVFSSGMNERGLAVADTHVVSLDIGPGLPRYALMQELLERCDSVPSAVDYLRNAVHMGAGTLVLADAEGGMAACESAYLHCDIEVKTKGWVLRTNHFLSDDLKELWLDTNPEKQRGNSEARYAFVKEALEASFEKIDVAWVQALLSTHEQDLRCLCHHPDEASNKATILSSVFLPATKQVWLADGIPCKTNWEMIEMVGQVADGNVES